MAISSLHSDARNGVGLRQPAMSQPKPKLLPISSPWDTWLFSYLMGESPDERLHRILSGPMPLAGKLSRDELLELSSQAIALLSPRFNEAEFHEVMQHIGAGPKFTTKDSARLLENLCRVPIIEVARIATKTRKAVYRISRSRRRRSRSVIV